MDVSYRQKTLETAYGSNLPQSPAKTNHDTGLLGMVAVLCMVIDHIGVIFYPGVTWLRVIGRIALPLFAWGIAIGAEHTRNIRKYALRLFIMIFISQPFYMLALNHPASVSSLDAFFASLKLNIFATLFLGLVAIWGIKENKGWMSAIAAMISATISMDYGSGGVFCVLLLWAVHNNPLTLAITFPFYCVIWGKSSSPVWKTEHFTFTLQAMAMLSLPLMLWPSSHRTKTPKWLMYAMYPGHLAILWFISKLA